MITCHKPCIFANSPFYRFLIIQKRRRKKKNRTGIGISNLRNTGGTGMDAKVRSLEFRWPPLDHFNVHLLKNKISFSGKTLSGIFIIKLWFRPSHTSLNVLQIVSFLVRIWNYDFDELWTIFFSSQEKVQEPSTNTRHNFWRFQLSVWFSGTVFSLVVQSATAGFLNSI